MVVKQDKEIVAEVLQGNVNDFRFLVEKYQQLIYNLTYSFTSDHEDSKEITQRIFVKVYSNLKLYNSAYKFYSWLYKIGVNESISYLKSKKKHSQLEESHITAKESPAIMDEKAEKEMLIRKAINRLKDKYRLLIVLKYYENLSYEEISKLTGESVKKVRSRLFTARQNLKNDLIRLL